MFRSVALVAVGLLVGACVLDTGGIGAGPIAQGGGGASMVTTSGGEGGAANVGGGATDGGGGASTTGGMGGDGPSCGDGSIDGGEACDDGNAVPDDGCTDCTIDEGSECTGEPSTCGNIPPAIVNSGSGLVIGVPDDERYDGTLASMSCVSLQVPDLERPDLQSVEVSLAMAHTYVGDLVIKLASAEGTVVTLMSRPGVGEPEDTSSEPNGDDSNLAISSPIRFAADGATDAEQMGSSLNNGGVVCADDGLCDYLPNPGSGPGLLSDLLGEDPAGTWQLCVADGDDGDSGEIDQVILTVLSW